MQVICRAAATLHQVFPGDRRTADFLLDIVWRKRYDTYKKYVFRTVLQEESAVSRYFMGVDADIGACRGVLLDEKGRCAAACSVPHVAVSVPPDLAELDADRAWWGGLCAVSRMLLQQAGAAPEEVAAVGCSATDPSLVALNPQGRPLRRALLSRFAAQTAAERTGRGLQQDTLPDPDGRIPDGLLYLLSSSETELFAQAAQFVTAGAFLTLRLTGEAVIDRHTGGRCAPLYDLQTGTWSETELSGLCRPAQLPRCAWSSEPAGRITAQAAAETGLREGTPVAAGVCSAGAVAAAAGLRPGRLLLKLDASVRMLRLTHRTPEPRPEQALPALTQEHWLYDTHVCDAGALTTQLDTDNLADLAEAGRELPPGCNGLIVLPYLRGAGAPFFDRQASGLVFGLKLHHTHVHLYRAAMEGICYAVAQYLLQLKGDCAVHHITVAGNGAGNTALCQLLSDICVARVDVCRDAGPAFGAARLAAAAAGFGEQVAQWGGGGDVFWPDLERHARYRPYLDAFRELYNMTHKIVHRDLSNYMYL